MPGVFIIEGAGLRLSGLKIIANDDGSIEMPPVTTHLRTDMWPTWLMDMIDAAAEAQAFRDLLPAAIAAEDEEEKSRLLHRELRASMRAITGAAFAMDAFYAALKARAGSHPDERIWRQKRTPRHAQIHATIEYHLGARTNTASKELMSFLKQVFRARGAAVHPGSQFREPVLRPELDAGVDWHFALFRAENAVTVAQSTVAITDALIVRAATRKAEIAHWNQAGGTAIAKVVVHYRSTLLPPVTLRSEQTS